ncbi:hypothetical protein Tco_1522268 [Tanacetum coccineum]
MYKATWKIFLIFVKIVVVAVRTGGGDVVRLAAELERLWCKVERFVENGGNGGEEGNYWGVGGMESREGSGIGGIQVGISEGNSGGMGGEEGLSWGEGGGGNWKEFVAGWGGEVWEVFVVVT